MSKTIDLLEKELRAWPGVTYEVVDERPHPKLLVACNNTRRFLPFSGTSVDRRGMLNKVTQLRRLLRDMGAEKK